MKDVVKELESRLTPEGTDQPTHRVMRGCPVA